jgi:hypothetical protein
MSVSDRTLVRLAWSTWATSIALLVAGVGMLLTMRYGFPNLPSGSYSGETTIIPAVYATLGLVVATRRPRHPVGWLLMGCGLTASIQGTVTQYASLAAAADLPGRVHGLWGFSLAQRAWFGLMVLLFLLFPTGQLPSSRWRPVAWSLVAGLGLVMITQALTPGTLFDFPEEQNPFGAPALEPILGPLGTLGGLLLVGGSLGAIAALIVRLRRSRGRERQQIKWFVYVALLGIAVIFVLGPLISGVIGQLPHGYGGVLGVLLNPWLLTPIALAVTVAAAIVRHQLYDIDRVINRTLVYGLLTLLLGTVYAVGVFVLGRLLAPGDGQSELAIAASTLAVAALFQPARRRLQSIVDRRFNRARYDAARTIAAFSTRLRDEIDLDTLSTELLAVVNQTVQPTQVSFWLRPMSMKSPSKAQPSNEANVA